MNRRMSPAGGTLRVPAAGADAIALGVAAAIGYALATHLLARAHSVGSSDDVLGGMWAAIAAVFVCRTTMRDSLRAASGRLSVTLLSLVLTEAYLLAFAVHPVGVGVAVAIGAWITTLAGDSDVVTGAITSIVVLAVASLEPASAWQEPILRLADTGLGAAVGLAVAQLLDTLDATLRTAGR